MLSLLLLAAVGNVALGAECPCSAEGGKHQKERKRKKTSREKVVGVKEKANLDNKALVAMHI